MPATTAVSRGGGDEVGGMGYTVESATGERAEIRKHSGHRNMKFKAHKAAALEHGLANETNVYVR